MILVGFLSCAALLGVAWAMWHLLEGRKTLALSRCSAVLIEHSYAHHTSNELVVLLMCSLFRRTRFFMDGIAMERTYGAGSFADRIRPLDECFFRLPDNIHVWREAASLPSGIERRTVEDLWFLHRLFYLLMMLRSSRLSRCAARFVIKHRVVTTDPPFVALHVRTFSQFRMPHQSVDSISAQHKFHPFSWRWAVCPTAALVSRGLARLPTGKCSVMLFVDDARTRSEIAQGYQGPLIDGDDLLHDSGQSDAVHIVAELCRAEHFLGSHFSTLTQYAFVKRCYRRTRFLPRRKARSERAE